MTTTDSTHQAALLADVDATWRHFWRAQAALLGGAVILLGIGLLLALLTKSTGDSSASGSTWSDYHRFETLPLLTVFFFLTYYRRRPKGSAASLYVAAFPLLGVINETLASSRRKAWTLVVDGDGARLERRVRRPAPGKPDNVVFDLAGYETVVLPRKVGKDGWTSYLGLVRDGRYVGGLSVVAPAARVRELLRSGS